MVYIDTNILVYLQNRSDKYHSSSKAIFDKYFIDKSICINQIVVEEFYSIITDSRKNRIAWTGQEAAKYIEFLTKSVEAVHTVNNEIIGEALSSVDKYKIKRYEIYDHLIAYSMKYYGIDTIITANKKDFQKYEFIKDIIVPEELQIHKTADSAADFISYGKQWIDQTDIGDVVSALTSDFLTQGPAVAQFEKAICEYTGAAYCVALSNATAALHIAVQALNIEHGKEGITSPNTFVASSNCFIYNNLKPVFADIDKKTFNIDPAEILKRITPDTRVVIPVHFAGRSCDMVKIKEIADKNKLHIIEDAAHAIGSNYKDGSKVGNCRYSDMTIFSFHPVKTITTGEGGAITTNSKEIYERLLLLRSHGITKDPGMLTDNPGPWYYEMQDCGYNYRITDIQAALGSSQMKRLDEFKKRRNEIIEKYNSSLSGVSWLDIPEKDDSDSCFHLYVVQIDFEKLGLTRTEVMDKLKSHNIGTQVHYIPVHTQPYYREAFGYKWGDYPSAENYYRNALSLPLYPKMSDEDVERVIENIKKILH